jgi:hypothetical protein
LNLSPNCAIILLSRSLLRNATIKTSLPDANEFCIDAGRAASARASCNMPCRCRQSKQSRKVGEKKCSVALEDREMHATVLTRSLFAKTLKMH